MFYLYKGMRRCLPENVVDRIFYGKKSFIGERTALSLYKDIKPLVSKRVGLLSEKYTLEEMGNINILNYLDSPLSQPFDKKLLIMLREFICIHRYDEPYVFRATIGEVLSQIPASVVREARYFEIIEKPENIGDFEKYPFALNRGYHLSRVMTYRLK